MMFGHRREREHDEEIQAHLRLAEQDRMRQGESPQDAAVSARRACGNVTLACQHCYRSGHASANNGTCRDYGLPREVRLPARRLCVFRSLLAYANEPQHAGGSCTGRIIADLGERRVF